MKSKIEAASAIIRSLARLQVLCESTARRLHTNNAVEQNTAEVKDLLSRKGTNHTFSAPGLSPSNAIVERRFESMFAAVRTALRAAPAPFDDELYWSLETLDAIDKSIYLPFRNNGTLNPSLHTSMQLKGCANDTAYGPKALIPYCQPGFMVNTLKLKKTRWPRDTSKLHQIFIQRHVPDIPKGLKEYQVSHAKRFVLVAWENLWNRK